MGNDRLMPVTHYIKSLDTTWTMPVDLIANLLVYKIGVGGLLSRESLRRLSALKLKEFFKLDNRKCDLWDAKFFSDND